MEVFEGNVVLRVSPERAFSYIGDPANGPKFDRMITSYEPEGGAIHEGGENHIRGRMLGLPYRAVSRTQTWDPPRRMVMVSVKPARPTRMTMTQTFEPVAEGTLVKYRAEFEPTGLGGRMLARLMRRWTARNFVRSARRLTALLSESADSETS